MWLQMMVIWWGQVLMLYAMPLIIYLLFAVPALYSLRGRALDDTARAVWALAIVGVPIMGVVSFTMMQPGERRP